MSDEPGLYIHIPFCNRLCPYCDFAVAVRRKPPFSGYVDAVIAEFEDRREGWPTRFGTLYFGGGTPGMLPVRELDRLIESVGGVAEGEVTLEANPNDVTDRRARAWKGLGINRLSLGVQSFDDDYLSRLGRDHSGATAHDAVRRAMGLGFRVSMDLIWGGPAYDDAILDADLARVEELGVGHVSAYELTVEPNTVFGRRHRRGELPLPDADAATRFGRRMVEGLQGLGFTRYEVSSYARSPSHRGVHNSGYWLGRPYLGIGTGAHSLERGPEPRRRINVRSLKDYMASPKEPARVEELSPIEHLRERLFLAARTNIGVGVDELRARFPGLDEAVWDAVARWHEHGVNQRLLERDSEVIRATPDGLDFADTSAALVWDYV